MMRPVLQLVVYGELGICWLAWLAAFVGPAWHAAKQRQVANVPSAHLGMVLNVLAFVCVGIHFRPPGFAKTMPELVASLLLGPPSVVLAWEATRYLGKQWHLRGALNANPELVTTGPYNRVRHPIYLSMLGMLLATGMGYTWWPWLVLGLVLLLLGIEICIRVEDKLLETYFQDEFIEYRARVRSYIPFLR
jgi:protein-S-isoprenylcysteine O-methyltransferase Ste14